MGSPVWHDLAETPGQIDSSNAEIDTRHDNAMAESIIGLYKAELITTQAPWKNVADVELATLSWVHWWNTKRLLEPIGYIPAVEYETNWRIAHHDHQGDTVEETTDTITHQITQ